MSVLKVGRREAVITGLAGHTCDAVRQPVDIVLLVVGRTEAVFTAVAGPTCDLVTYPMWVV